MSSPSYVLDASAVLAFLQREAGADAVEEVVDSAAISTVNLGEILQKAASRGKNAEIVLQGLKTLNLTILEHTEQDAVIGSKLWQDGKRLGLSLADRACLAMAKRLDLPVLTTDKVWKKLDLEVVVIR